MYRSRFVFLSIVLAALGPSLGWAQQDASLKAVFEGAFRFGAALNKGQIMGEFPEEMALVQRQFNALTPENTMKWEKIHPLEDQYDWEVPDALVQFAQDNDMHLTGHVLVWHQQTPDWVFQDAEGNPASRELLLERMQSHISTVVAGTRAGCTPGKW